MSIGKHEEARGGPVQAEGATLEQNVFSNIGLSIDREHKNSRLKLKFQKSFLAPLGALAGLDF